MKSLGSGEPLTEQIGTRFALEPKPLMSSGYGGDLTQDEQALIVAAFEGRKFDPSSRASIRAAVLVHLLTGKKWGPRAEAWQVHHSGIFISNCCIVGKDVNLAEAVLIRQLWIEDSVFTERGEGNEAARLAHITLRDAHGTTLGFKRCTLARIAAEGLRLENDFYFEDSHCENGIGLEYAKIGGKLTCNGSTLGSHDKEFENDPADHNALNCRSAEIEGSVHLTWSTAPPNPVEENSPQRFAAKQRDFVQTFMHRGGQANPQNSHSRSPSRGKAIEGNGRAFAAHGKVNFTRANVVGRVDMRGAQVIVSEFIEEDRGRRIAVHGDGARVSQSVMVGDGFAANGEFNLVRSEIGEDLNLAGGKFISEVTDFDQDATASINLHSTKIDGSLFLDQPRKGARQVTKKTELDGRLILTDVSCRTFCDGRSELDTIDDLVAPKQQLLDIDGFRYGRLGDCPKAWRVRLEWFRRQKPEHISEGFRPQPWTQLIRVLRDMGYDKDATQLAMKRETMRRKSGTLGFRDWVANLFVACTVGHGYRPLLPIVWAAFIFFPGWLIFTVAAERGWMTPRSVEVLSNEKYWEQEACSVPEGYRPLDPFLYTLDVLLPIIDQQNDLDWAPSNKQRDCAITSSPLRSWLEAREWNKLMGLYDSLVNELYDRVLKGLFEGGLLDLWRWITIICGWVLVPLFVAGASGIMKKERQSVQ